MSGAPEKRSNARGESMADGCWSCVHYANHGGNSGGTPPWSTCAFRLEYPNCSRWALSDQPWRYMENWREAVIDAALNTGEVP